MSSDWKIQATEFLSSKIVTKAILQNIWKKLSTKSCSDLKKEDLVNGIVEKIKTPQDLLSKQDISVAMLRYQHSLGILLIEI
jgi:hypothetical protein